MGIGAAGKPLLEVLYQCPPSTNIEFEPTKGHFGLGPLGSLCLSQGQRTFDAQFATVNALIVRCCTQERATPNPISFFPAGSMPAGVAAWVISGDGLF